MTAQTVHRFGSSAAELSCALVLSRSRSVVATVPPTSKSALLLRAAGFRPLASEWHCVRDLRGNLRPRDRKSQLALKASLSAWRANGLGLKLTTVSDVGLSRLEEEFYYPILVRDLYTKGRAPYGAQNLSQFRRLTRPETLVALVCKGNRVCGAGLLRSEDLSRLDILVAGSHRTDLTRSISGNVYCLEEGLENCRRAFLHALAIAAAQGGWSALSYGADTAWVDRGYVPVILEKLRWADMVLAAVGGTQPFFHPGTPAEGAGMPGLVLVAHRATARFEQHAIDTSQSQSLTTRLARINFPIRTACLESRSQPNATSGSC